MFDILPPTPPAAKNAASYGHLVNLLWQDLSFNPALRTALEGRGEDDVSQTVDRFYDSYRNDVAANPSGHAMDYIHIILDIEKTA